MTENEVTSIFRKQKQKDTNNAKIGNGLTQLRHNIASNSVFRVQERVDTYVGFFNSSGAAVFIDGYTA